MPTLFDQTTDLFLNVRGPQYPARFFANLETFQEQAVIQFVQGDTVTLRLWLCTPSVATLDVHHGIVLANGGIAFVLKANVDVSETPIAIAGTFNLVYTETTHYEATLDLNTVEALALFSTGNAKEMPVRLEIELQSQGNSQRLTFAREIKLVKQAYQMDSAPPPSSSGQPYPQPEDIPSILNQQAIIDAAVAAAVTAAIPSIVSAAAAAVPRVTRVEMATLPPSSQNTASIQTPDPSADPNSPSTPSTQLLSLGVAQGTPGAVTAIPAQFTTGTAYIGNGAGTVPVAFPTPYAQSPVVFGSVVSPGAGSPDIWVTSITSVSATGFTAALSDTAATSGYTLTYIAIANN